ncbi:MAG: sigma-70 family RNA polymerase sigma factor [bacterium]|nr:sigma-70 family RNA polymerase sigma factor [candidate division KSB1 bacterium]MDH7560413.1 sigma-70 family RNA polymerase sigma factor [bacterium]
MQAVDERQLLQQARRGDKAAFGTIVERYQSRVFALALRTLGDRGLAREASHEAFVRLYCSLHRVDLARPLFTYLYRIVVNLCYDIVARERRSGRGLARDEDAQEEPDHDAGPEEETERAELFAVVRSLAQRLGVKRRAAFVLRDLEGLEIGEIARILRCRQSTVRSHLCLARRALRDIIESEFPELLER